MKWTAIIFATLVVAGIVSDYVGAELALNAATSAQEVMVAELKVEIWVAACRLGALLFALDVVAYVRNRDSP